MSIPRPKVPVRIIKGTSRALAVEHGEDITVSGTRVWEITDLNTGCLSDPIPGSYPVDTLDGLDAGTVTIYPVPVVA